MDEEIKALQGCKWEEKEKGISKADDPSLTPVWNKSLRSSKAGAGERVPSIESFL